MPLATLRSESLLTISGSRLRKSARSPKVTEPPDFGGPAALPCPPPPPPPHAAMASSAAVSRIPSDRLRMALLSPLGWPQRPPHQAVVATAYTRSDRCAHRRFAVRRA